MKDPKSKRLVTVTEKCEWCEKYATHRIACDRGYRRFSCDVHYERTRTLVMLDGRGDDPVIVTIKDRFTHQVYL